MDGDQKKGPADGGMPGGDKLGQKRNVEDAHFGVKHIPQHPTQEPVTRGMRFGRVGVKLLAWAQEQLNAQPTKVSCSAPFLQGISQLRNRQ